MEAEERAEWGVGVHDGGERGAVADFRFVSLIFERENISERKC